MSGLASSLISSTETSSLVGAGTSNLVHNKPNMPACAISLHVHGADSAILTGGSPLRGHVELHLPHARRDKIGSIHVKLRGVAETSVGTYALHGTSPLRTEKTVFIRSDSTVWPTRFAAPPDDLERVHLPFEFDLSLTLPPSYCCTGQGKSGRVWYYVEAIGERSGILRTKRRVRTTITLLPSLSPFSSGVKEELLAGWDGGWKSLKVEREVRINSSGLCTLVKAEVFLPNLTSYPMSTPVPFRLSIRGNGITEILPAPSSIALSVNRAIWVKADIVADTIIEKHKHSYKPSKHTNWTLNSTPSGESVWSFDSRLIFEGPPSFKLSTIALSHYIHLRIPFPGVGNNLDSMFTIQVDSGLASGDAPPPWEPSNSDCCSDGMIIRGSIGSAILQQLPEESLPDYTR